MLATEVTRAFQLIMRYRERPSKEISQELMRLIGNWMTDADIKGTINCTVVKRIHNTRATDERYVIGIVPGEQIRIRIKIGGESRTVCWLVDLSGANYTLDVLVVRMKAAVQVVPVVTEEEKKLCIGLYWTLQGKPFSSSDLTTEHSKLLGIQEVESLVRLIDRCSLQQSVVERLDTEYQWLQEFAATARETHYAAWQYYYGLQPLYRSVLGVIARRLQQSKARISQPGEDSSTGEEKSESSVEILKVSSRLLAHYLTADQLEEFTDFATEIGFFSPMTLSLMQRKQQDECIWRVDELLYQQILQLHQHSLLPTVDPPSLPVHEQPIEKRTLPTDKPHVPASLPTRPVQERAASRLSREQFDQKAPQPFAAKPPAPRIPEAPLPPSRKPQNLKEVEARISALQSRMQELATEESTLGSELSQAQLAVTKLQAKMTSMRGKQASIREQKQTVEEELNLLLRRKVELMFSEQARSKGMAAVKSAVEQQARALGIDPSVLLNQLLTQLQSSGKK